MHPSLFDVEVLRRALLLYSAMVRHKLASARFENDFYPISCGSDCVRIGRPDRQSPEVSLLIREGLVVFVGSAQNPSVPENSLRMLRSGEPRADELVRLCAQLEAQAVTASEGLLPHSVPGCSG